MDETLHPFLLGVLVTACAVIGLYFWRFWRRSREGLFLSFALAFWLFGCNWAVLVFLLPRSDGEFAVYLFRLAGFGIIVAGVVAKNRNFRVESSAAKDRM